MKEPACLRVNPRYCGGILRIFSRNRAIFTVGSYSQCLLLYAVCYNIVHDHFSLFRVYAGNGVIIRECAKNAASRASRGFTRALSPGNVGMETKKK